MYSTDFHESVNWYARRTLPFEFYKQRGWQWAPCKAPAVTTAVRRKNFTSTLATASASLLPQAKNFTLQSNASCRMKSGASRWFAKSQTNTTGRAVRALAPHQITLQYTQTLAPPWALHMRQHPAQQGCACACAAPPSPPAPKLIRSKRRDDRAMITRKRQAT